MNKSIMQMIVGGILFGVSPSLLGSTFTYSNFASTQGLALNGVASTINTSNGSVLRITYPTTQWTGTSPGSVFTTTKYDVSRFSTCFKFRLGGGANGMVFTIQTGSPYLIGGGGGNIAYQGLPANKVGIEFDTYSNPFSSDHIYDPSVPHVGIVTSTTDHGPGCPFTSNVSDLSNGQDWFAWVDYNGTNLELRMSRTFNKPELPILSKYLDIPSILGGSSAYVGFTGTSAPIREGQGLTAEVINWSFEVPEPFTFSLLVLGGLALLRRHKS